MTEPSPNVRPLRLRRAPVLTVGHDGEPEAPDVERDFVPTTLPEILKLDLARASLTVDPTFYCNLSCRFCDLPVTSKLAVDWSRVSTAVLAMVAVGLRDAHIIGGEPGIYPGTPALLTALRDLGLRPALFTHGMWAQSRERLARMCEAGLASLVVSIKAFDDDTAERLTGKRGVATSQARAIDVLIAGHRDGLAQVTFNHVITRPTLESMAEPDWVEQLPQLPSLSLSLIEPYRADMRPLVPEPERLAATLPGILERLAARGIPVTVDGAPACRLGAFAHQSRDLGRLDDDRIRINIKPRESADYLLVYRGYQRLRQFARAPGCRGCVHEARCPGIHRRLLDWYGDAMVSPVAAAPRSQPA